MTNTISIEGMSDLIDAIEQGGGGGSSTLSGLTDVDITSASNGQVLTYDSTSEKWENSSLPAGVDDLNDLTDVTITSATDGQVLKYDGTSQKWVNGSAGGGSGSLSVAEHSITGQWEETSNGSGEWKAFISTSDLGITEANDIISVMVCSPTNDTNKNVPKAIYQVTTLEKSSADYFMVIVKNTIAPTGAWIKVIYA